MVVYIEDALAELPGGRRLAEDLPPTMERLEKAEDQVATFVKALNKRIASWPPHTKSILRVRDRLSTLAQSVNSKNHELAASAEAVVRRPSRSQ